MTINGEHSLAESRKALLSNSTKRRVTELNSLCDRLTTEGISDAQIGTILEFLFITYPLYVDPQSRKAVERCLSTISTIPNAGNSLTRFVQELRQESSKEGIAPANAFVLIRWSSLLIQSAASMRPLWDKLGVDLLSCLTNALNTLLGLRPKQTTTATALRVSRRALRTLAKSDFGLHALNECISSLCAKTASPIPKNAILLGIIAGVCKRLPGYEKIIEKRKNDYIAFYLKEILGSRTHLPSHIGRALHDFFSSFITPEELKKEIVPAVEKALLRAPEVVLNDLVSPVFASLPKALDLSDILASGLLKSLMSNIKSTNAVVRDGAVHTFQVIATRCGEQKYLEKIADELLSPLKTNKVPSSDQRIIHARMIGSLHPMPALATRILPAITAVVAKETNEAAVAAEVSVITRQVICLLQASTKLEQSVADMFVRGLSDRRMPVRRTWGLAFTDVIWTMDDQTLNNEESRQFIDAIVGTAIEVINEVVANPISAVQSGQLSVAQATAAVALVKLSKISGLSSANNIKKANIVNRILTVDPRPSFLLNPKIYSKLVIEEDLVWYQRAIFALFPLLPTQETNAPVAQAWSQAIIYLIVAQTIPAQIHNTAWHELHSLYKSVPETVSAIIIRGLWAWCQAVESEAKDSAAINARTGRDNLFKVVRAICSERQQRVQHKLVDNDEVLSLQMTKLLVLCQPQIIKGASWIETCLSTGIDPGKLASENSHACLAEILSITEDPDWKQLPVVQSAAYSATAELAFVAPAQFTPLLVSQISGDLNPTQLHDIGPTEAAIFRTPEGTTFVDVLSSQGQSQSINKNSKDYETLKWEQELRAQLASKTTQAKKLTPDEQAKVQAQLAKESAIRQQVARVDGKLRRGIGIIAALASGPPTEAEVWFGPSVKLLFEIILAGAGLILGDAAALTYLLCANKTSSRLETMRPFVGVATLRAARVSILPSNLLAEPLRELVLRVLYRLRFLGEQRPLDNVTLSYVTPLLFLIIDQGGIEGGTDEDADEQLVLAIEILSFHTATFDERQLPRLKALETLIRGMQKYTQHFRELRDCFADLCRCIAPSIVTTETDTIVKGAIVPQSSVRGAVLQAISADLELTDRDFYEEIWLACHEDDDENREIAQEIWEENDLKVKESSALQCLPYLDSKDPQLRRAAARATMSAIKEHMDTFPSILETLKGRYTEFAQARKPEKDRYGMPIKKDLADCWETRHGIALTFSELAPIFPAEELVPFMSFLIESGPLGDQNTNVRDAMVQAATSIVTMRGQLQLEPLLKLFESTLANTTSTSQSQDEINEAVVILYGALAQHLLVGDDRIPKIVQRLLSTLSTPSESVQYAVAQCLPPLVRASTDQASTYLQQMIDEALHAKKYASRRGAAYGLAGIVKGKGISILKDNRVLSALRIAAENKKDASERQGAFLSYELLSHLLGRLFEPYVVQIVPQLLAGFGDSSADVREACLDAAKTCFSSLSSYGVKQVLPILLEGLGEQQWRSKKGASDSLGAMAYLDPEQLAVSLPDIIPPLTEVLNDSHKEVRASANRSLQRFGEVISNPEVKSQVNILLKALSDPTKYTDDALDALIKVNFIHYLDAPSLALIVRILERGLADRSTTKRKAAQIIGSLAHLTERKDLIVHLPPLVAGLRGSIVDPVPATRATASKALGSTIEKLGEDALPDLIPSLMQTLKSESSAGDRLGSAQALSEVLAGLGTVRLEETLPSILQNVSSTKPSVREGFMSLFIYLPACFGQSFANYLARIIPSILAGLADEVESIRETALRAGRLLVKNFAARSVDLLLPELERGLADDSHRIRLSSVELVGDLLFNLTGISGKAEAEDDFQDTANEAGQSLLEVLGEEKRNKVLSALYICRCDTSGLVRSAAIAVWKALVSSHRTLRELMPTLTQLLIVRLASSNPEQKVIAGNALGELIRKAGDGVMATLLPTLEEGLHTSTDVDARSGICIALRELITSASSESLEQHEKTLISVVRTALVDPDENVREAAAEAFDSLQKTFGKRAIDQVLPHLLSLLRSQDEADNALAALLTLLTETTRSNAILPNLLPTLLTSPINSFNAKALASLAEVAGSAMTRRLPHILNALMDNIVACKDEALLNDLDSAFDTVLLSVDELDGLSTMMTVMLTQAKHDDHRRRAAADMHLAKFFESSELDYSRYYTELIRALLGAFDDGDSTVVKAAWTALNALTSKLRKEEMDALVISTRQTLNHVCVAGHNLPGFSLPKGLNAVLPIFLQGLMNGTAEQRTQAALALSDLIDRTSPEGLRPFVTHIAGPLIRVVSERSTDLKCAIMYTLTNLLEKIPTFLKPFLPQLQRTFTKSLADPSSELLRSRAARALGTLIPLTPRIDPLIGELITGSKTSDAGVRNAMLKALYEVVSKAGKNMGEASRNAILGLIDSDVDDSDDSLNITYAKLLGALTKVLPLELATSLAKSRVLSSHYTQLSMLGLNSILFERPEVLTGSLSDATQLTITRGMAHSQTSISANCVLAAGKFLLTPSSNKSSEAIKPLIEALARAITPGEPIDTRRLALVVVRTAAREHHDTLAEPYLGILVPPIFGSVRDVVIPVKLAAEAAFLAIFNVVEEDSAIFDQFMASPAGNALPPATKRGLQEYFKRIALRLSAQAKERKEAEGGQGGLGLSSDEREDEREVWSVGKVDLGEGSFGED